MKNQNHSMACMIAFSKKTAQAIRQERLLVELQITGLIPKLGIVERIGDAATYITETLTTALSVLGPLNKEEKAMDSSRRALMAEAERESRQGAILIAADHVATQRGDNYRSTKIDCLKRLRWFLLWNIWNALWRKIEINPPAIISAIC